MDIFRKDTEHMNCLENIREELQRSADGGDMGWMQLCFEKERDADVFEFIRKRIPDAFGRETIKITISGYAFSLSIIFGEYNIAEKYLDNNKYSIYFTEDTTIRTDSGSSGREIWNEFPLYNDDLLYSKNIDIPEKLRFKMLKRLNERNMYGSAVNIRNISGLYSSKVQAKIINDYNRHPEYFIYRNGPSMIDDIRDACFLMRLYRDDPDKLKTLMKKRIDYNEIDCISLSSEYVNIRVRMLERSCAYEWLGEYKPVLYAILICLYTGIEKACEEDILYMILDDEEHNAELNKIKKIKAEFARFIRSFSMGEDDFMKSMEIIKKLGMTKTIHALSFGRSVLKRKPVFVVNRPDGLNIESFFGIEKVRDEDTSSDTNENSLKMCRYMRFAESIGKIRYGDKDNEELKRQIVSILKSNAEVLRDSFLVFAEKGLIPEECLDYVTDKVNRSPDCAYMVPVMIMQKYGGLRSFPQRKEEGFNG
ncbi:MAG: hypothetical protein K6G22_11485 [Lachnospiraceae bacterium]|nr:hypothetical protein [Lachnospiraceae bacterium]